MSLKRCYHILYDYYIVNYDNFNIYTYFDKNKDISKVKFSPFNDSNNGIEKLKEVRKDLEKLYVKKGSKTEKKLNKLEFKKYMVYK